MKSRQERDLYFSSDWHGEIKTNLWNIINRYDIADANIIVCGDFGFDGFNKKSYYDDIYKKIEPKLEKNNIEIFAIRGNHDSLEYFNNDYYNYPRIKYVPDHEIMELSGKTIYPIGGAQSIDMKFRLDYNSNMEKYGSSKRIWWEDERPIKKYRDLPNKVDIIVSHEAPISFLPVITRDSNMTEEVYNNILEDRNYLDYIFRNIRCSRWFFGHYHCSLTSSLENVLYKCLDINELYKLNK